MRKSSFWAFSLRVPTAVNCSSLGLGEMYEESPIHHNFPNLYRNFMLHSQFMTAGNTHVSKYNSQHIYVVKETQCLLHSFQSKGKLPFPYAS